MPVRVKGWISAKRMTSLALTLALAGCSRPPPPTVELTVDTDGDFLAFKPDSLTAPAGAHVILTFHHRGAIISQEHDWVLLKAGTLPAVMAASDKMAETMGATEGKSSIPPGDPRVIAATPLIKKGETTTVSFTAPAPGDYPFFCSTPGHGDMMHGVLHVTPK